MTDSDAPQLDPRLTPFDEHNRLLRERVRPPSWTNPTAQRRYDLVVVGAGTAGLVASAIAAEMGARVAMIESGLAGGDCLVTGCVPSKSLLHSARLALRHRSDAAPDFDALMRRMRRIRADIARHDAVEAFAERGVEVHLGEARCIAPDAVEVAGQRLNFIRAVLATGAEPVAPPIEGLADAEPLTSESVFSLTRRPRRMAVVGAGAQGCELSQAFAAFGVEVTLIEQRERVLPTEIPDASRVLHEALEASGVRVLTGASIRRVERRAETSAIRLNGAQGAHALEVDRVLVAAGRRARTGGLDLDRAGVALDDGAVRVDHRLRTTNRRIYAAGDCCMSAHSTHGAHASARIAVRNALFLGRGRADRLTIPRCVYTTPEVASAGDSAGDPGAEPIRIPFSEVDRAITEGDARGFLDLRLTPRGDIRGATIVGDGAGDLITILTEAMDRGVRAQRLSQVVFPYPTRAEIIRLACERHELRSISPLTRRAAAGALRLRRWIAR